MNNIPKKIIVAVSGASGSIYAKVLFDKLEKYKKTNSEIQIGVVMSKNAKDVWKHELGNNSYDSYSFSFYDKNDFMAPFASGSAMYTAMIACPCSMGTLARISAGISNDLVTRSADVILKERRKLVLITRETPLNLIQINNMRDVTLAGAIVLPASPSFYSIPKSIEEIASTVVDRSLDIIGVPNNSYRWSS